MARRYRGNQVVVKGYGWRRGGDVNRPVVNVIEAIDGAVDFVGFHVAVVDFEEHIEGIVREKPQPIFEVEVESDVEARVERDPTDAEVE